jgi:hypothetical protein
MVGRLLGWKVLLLVHDRQSIKKYERILDLNFRGTLPDVGPQANKSLAWTAVQKISSYWKAVKGEVPEVRTREVTTIETA